MRICPPFLMLVVLLAPWSGAAAEPAAPIALKPLSVAEGGYAYPRPFLDDALQVLVSRGEGWVLFAARIAASGAVASAFADVMLAAERHDQAGAEAAFSSLAERSEFNSAEWTLRQIAASRMQREWGTPLEEYMALRGALAGGSAAFAALPPGYRRSALMDDFRLLLALGRYADARRVGDEALRIAEDGDTKARVNAALAKVDRIVAAATPTRMTLQLGPAGDEGVRLSRRQFGFVEGGAAVTEARLFCREGAVEVPLQAGAVYQVDAGATDCRLDLVGSPNANVVIEER